MNIDLTGKTALVTASTAGIGFAIAEGLARAGARVALNGRTQSSVENAKNKLAAKVPNAELVAIAADLSDAKGVATVREALDEIDILVNNAGIYGPQDFFETGDDVWERYFQVNVMSGVRLSRTYLPAPAERGAEADFDVMTRLRFEDEAARAVWLARVYAPGSGVAEDEERFLDRTRTRSWAVDERVTTAG